MNLLCAHGDKEWRCPTCCLMHLRRDLPRLKDAVQNHQRGLGGGSGAFGSRVPTGFGTAAFALLQDITQAGGLDYIERDLNTLLDHERLQALRRDVRQYRSRCALILHDALAPFPLLWPNNDPVLCPVVDERGSCNAELLVHRDNDQHSDNFGQAAVIRCRYDDDHEWSAIRGDWLRLGVLFGGVA